MPRLTDETLMAFADGELSAEEHQAVANLLASSEEDARRLQMFKVTSRGALAKSYDAEIAEAASESLIEVVDRFKAVSAEAEPEPSPSTGPARVMRLNQPRWNTFPQSAAALGLSLIIGGLLGWFANEQWSTSTTPAISSPFLAGGALHSVLETKKSRQKLMLSDGSAGGSMQARLSFVTHAGTYCRQYQAVLETGEGFNGVACRQKAGRWQIKLHIPTKIKSRSANDYTLASRSGKNASDELIRAMKSGDVLTIDQEQQLIERSWSSTM